jgi:hypothetical protein
MPVDIDRLSTSFNLSFSYLPVSEELGIRARLLSEGGPKLWAEFMDELRENHLGVKRRRKAGPSVGERLQAAYETVCAANRYFPT